VQGAKYRVKERVGFRYSKDYDIESITSPEVSAGYLITQEVLEHSGGSVKLTKLNSPIPEGVRPHVTSSSPFSSFSSSFVPFPASTSDDSLE